jgi:hypothetical protein
LERLIDDAAEELLSQLSEKKIGIHRDSPVVFIGHGLGAVIIQRAVTLEVQRAAASEPTAPEQQPVPESGLENRRCRYWTCVFLDAPPPSVSVPVRISKKLRHTVFPEPNINVLKLDFGCDSVEKWKASDHLKTVTAVWKQFREAGSSARAPITWLYSEIKYKPKVRNHRIS